MRLLEFHYWSDVVLGLTIFISFGIVALIILVSMILCRVSCNKPVDETAANLEKQMDDWLLKLDTAFGKLEQVSKKVDSTK